MSIWAGPIREQLIGELGVASSDIVLYDAFIGSLEQYRLIVYQARERKESGLSPSRRILVVTAPLSYTGSCLAAVYALGVLEEMGYETFIAAPDGDLELIKEITRRKTTVFICANLNYAQWDELIWMEMFGVVIVNTLLMLPCIQAVRGHKPCCLWLHEAAEIYGMMAEKRPEVMEMNLEEASVCAVSRIAAENFTRVFRHGPVEILPPGIPDEWEEIPCTVQENRPLVIAVIGSITWIKGQDILLNAMELLSDQDRESIEIWFVGPVNEHSGFCTLVVEKAGRFPGTRFLGGLTRREVTRVYTKTDVIVCPSREETVSLAVGEGMMHGKVCIVSAAAGAAEYIKDGENGLVFEACNPKALRDKLAWIIHHKDRLKLMGENARKAYKTYFSMEKFGENLERVIKNLMEGGT